LSSKNREEQILHEAGLSIKSKKKTHAGEIIEVEIRGFRDYYGVISDIKDEGLVIGIRVELPAKSELRGVSLNSGKAMRLLGTLTVSLISRGLHAQLLIGRNGLEGLLISCHVCHDKLDSSYLKKQILKLGKIVETISHTLAESNGDAIERVKLAITPGGFSSTFSNPRPVKT
jgi:hypothetical protein